MMYKDGPARLIIGVIVDSIDSIKSVDGVHVVFRVLIFSLFVIVDGPGRVGAIFGILGRESHDSQT